MSRKIHSYEHEILSRLKNAGEPCILDMIGSVQYEKLSYPFYRVIIGDYRGNINPTVVISAGIHAGPEPAGVFACLDFIENHAYRYSDYNIIIYPCINPGGFEFSKQKNPAGCDLNDSFSSENPPQEVLLFKKSLLESPQNFAFSLDMHEDNTKKKVRGFKKKDNPKQFYLYETCKEKDERLGLYVNAAVKKIAPVCEMPYIYNDPSEWGVIWHEHSRDGNNENSLEGYLSSKCNHSFTTETPTCWDFDMRINVHVLALNTILDKFREKVERAA